MMRKIVVVSVLCATLAGGSGCAITGMAMLPGSGNYQRTVMVSGMLLDFGIGYLIASLDQNATSDEVFVNGLLFGSGVFAVDLMVYNALSGDIADQAGNPRLRLDYGWSTPDGSRASPGCSLAGTAFSLSAARPAASRDVPLR